MKTFSTIICAIVILIVLAYIFPTTDPAGTKRILEDQGYTSVEITGWRPFSRGNDVYSTGFRATSPAGKTVTGAVTRGWMKGGTIRFD